MPVTPITYIMRYSYNSMMFTLSGTHALAELAAKLSKTTHTHVEIVESTGSSNQDLLDQASQLPFYPAPARMRIALTQTQGRGRRGKSWETKPGQAFLGSLGLSTSLAVPALSLLPLYIGTSLARCIESWGIPAQIKWPNDIWINGSKVAGILVEVRQLSNNPIHTAVVIGLGLNWSFAPPIEGKSTCCITDYLKHLPNNSALLNSNIEIAQNACTQIVHALTQAWENCINQTPLQFSKYDALKGALISTDSGLSGHCLGINALGELGLQTQTTTHWLNSGEVSIQLTRTAS